jgi:beta-N-acetylhexosaminidase
MIDIAGTALTELDRQRLCHPLVGGIILFSRNFASREQLTALTAEIHALRQPPLLIAVDHEGGRVQRFREGFTRLPAMRSLGCLYDRDPAAALAAARDVGFVLAAELRACGVDYSFTPVLDLDYGPSRVIGDRAFHRDPAVVSALATALGEGLKQAGMGTAASIIRVTVMSSRIRMSNCRSISGRWRRCRKTCCRTATCSSMRSWRRM